MSHGPSPGEVLGDRYELRAQLLETPAYRSLRAFDREVEVEVDLWWVRPEVAPDQRQRDAFVAAATEARALHHVHLRRIHDVGVFGDDLYVVCQLPTTTGLAGRLRAGHAADDDELWRYAEALATALSAAHERGLLHGRLTARDVAMVAARIKIGGVGLLSRADPGLWAGEPLALAPELRGGGQSTPAADVYAMASILGELAVGKVGEAARRRLPELRPDLGRVLAPALRDAPERRPASPLEVLAQIGELLGKAPGPVEPPSPAGGAADVPLPEALAPPTTIDLSALTPPPDDAATAIDAAALTPPPDDAAEPTAIDPAAGAGAAPADASQSTMFSAAVPPAQAERPRFSRQATDPPAAAGPATAPTRDTPGREAAPASTPPAYPSYETFGSYVAPPRRSQRGPVWTLVVGALAAAALASAGVLVCSPGSERAAAEADAADAAVRATLPKLPPPLPAEPVVTAASRCPPDMVLVEEAGVCVDTHEAPGRGRLPTTGITRADAAAQCAARGARLCTADEWETACRGDGGASFPYGESYERGACNLRGDIAAAGSHPECVDHRGLYDMSGNVAEWVAEGAIRGGSAEDGSRGRCSTERRRPGRQPAYSDVGFRCCAEALAPPE